MPRYKQFPCVSNGLIFVASVDNKLSINVRIYQMSHISKEIVNRDPEGLHLQLNTDCKTQIVNFKFCVEPNTGLSLPVLVVFIEDNGVPVKIKPTHGTGASIDSVSCKRVYFFGIQYTTHKKEILPLRYYKVEHEISRDITVLSDMVMMWMRNEILHMAVSSSHNKTVLCDIQHRITSSNDFKNVTKEKLIWAGKPQGICDNNYLVLCRVAKNVEISDRPTDIFLENDVSFQFKLVLLTQKADGHWCQQALSVSDLIPEMYAANLVNIFVITCKLKHSVSTLTSTNMAETPRACQTFVDSHVIALLEDGYFIELKCGQIQNCFQLDHPCFQSNCSCEIFSLLCTDNMEQLAVIKVQSSEGTDCLAVNLNKRQVSHHWINIAHVLTGDFVHLGKQQLLILFSDWSFESCTGSWVFTDFGVTQIDTRHQTDVPSTSLEIDTSSNVQAVVKALASRLQKSRISLQEDENDLTVKKQFILSTWKRLEQRGVGNGSSDLCSDLMVPMVTLVEGSQTSEVSTCKKSKSIQHLNRIQIDLEQVWQHVVGDRWVVGIKAVNNSERSITDCVLSLVSKSSKSTKHCSTWPPVPEDQDGAPVAVKSLHGIAKRLKLDVDSLPLARKDKKIIRHSETATVVCCTSLPCLDFKKEISYSVIMYFVELDELDTQYPPNTDVICVFCGEVIFRVQDYIDGKYSVRLNKNTISETSAEEWETVRAAMDCAQLSVQLRVCSTFTVLSNMGALLVQQTGFALHKESQSYVCCRCEALNLVRIQIHSVKSSKEVILRVSARDENQILFTVQYLYSHLPDDISVLPSNEDDIQDVICRSLSCMADEIHYVTAAVRDLCATDDHIVTAAGDGLQEGMGSDAVSKIQDTFKQQQQAFQDQTQGYVSKEKYVEFLKHVQMCEQQTDNSFSHVENL